MERLTVEDQYYIKGIAKGDTAVTNQFYKAYFGTIADFILSNNGTIDDAKDVFQDVVMVIYQKAKKGDLVLTAKLNTFIYSICRNVWFKRLRKTKKEASNNIDELPPLLDPGMEESLEQQSKYKLFRTKFAQLGEDCQKLFSYFFAKKKMREIAMLLGYSSEGYAKKKKYKCQQSLIKLIKADGRFKELTS